MIKLKLHDSHVIVQGPTWEESGWGYYQFPKVYALGGKRLAASVHLLLDTYESYGGGKGWFVSEDEGVTWRETSSDIQRECGFPAPSGDLLFPLEQPIRELADMDVPPFRMAAYSLPSDSTEDLVKSRNSEKFPEGIGIFRGTWGEPYRTYTVDSLPDGFLKKEWKFLRCRPATGEAKEEFAAVNWPYMPVHTIKTDHLFVTAPNLWGNIKRAPDGSLWAAHYDMCGTNPKNGAHYIYSAAYLFRSEDDGRSWNLVSHLPYQPDADADKLAFFRDGWTEPEIEFMPDGSMIMLLRLAGVFHGAPEWAPSYITRSTDGGRTWAKPRVFDKCGVIPQLRRLACGVTLAVYGRPGIYVRATRDPAGLDWEEPAEIMTDGDRSGLANDPPARPSFHQWAGSCCNQSAAVVADDRIVVGYSDFYVPDARGVKRKTCLSKVVEVL